MTSPLTCGVLFESDPVWLWSIRPNSWNKIYITLQDEIRLRRDHPCLFRLLSSRLATIQSTKVSPDFMLISGGRDFIDMVSLSPNGSNVYWMSKTSRRTPSDTENILWTKVLHRNVGGVTEARGTFGIDHRSPRIQLEKDVHRSLAHVVKYSIRPKACDPDTDEDHYKLSNLLSLSFPRRPVLYPTYMSRTGWGLRILSDLELSSCFDLPDYVPWDDRFLRDIVPLQMFRSVIDYVSGSSCIQSPPAKRRLKLSISSDSSHEMVEDVVWVESVGKWLPGSWADAEISDKAVKSDNAPIDFRPWNRRIQLLFPCSIDTIGILERFAMRRWRFNVCRSLFQYLKAHYGSTWRTNALSMDKRSLAVRSMPPRKRGCLSGSRVIEGDIKGGIKEEDVKEELVEGLVSNERKDLQKDVVRGLKVIGQILRSTWWEWTTGSSPLFWRWNGEEQLRAARDGMHIFVQGCLPRSQRGVKLPRFDTDTRCLVSSKIESMISKSYLEVDHVQTFLHYFAVPKGDTDIRVVFDGTSCGLNEVLWSPNFFLPTSRNASELLSFDSWMADVDFGEFFHNFFSDERIRKHAGVNTSSLAPFLPVSLVASKNVDLKFVGLRWSRLFMGMRPSPYNAVRFYYWAEEFAKGNLRDVSNPFGLTKSL
ncbi:hypothetical protein MHU86_2413 [Fragilaria crotonensis]|nr:hypothetical protein MHU86_2413 [Fragilaria crotonensis]